LKDIKPRCFLLIEEVDRWIKEAKEDEFEQIFTCLRTLTQGNCQVVLCSYQQKSQVRPAERDSRGNKIVEDMFEEFVLPPWEIEDVGDYLSEISANEQQMIYEWSGGLPILLLEAYQVWQDVTDEYQVWKDATDEIDILGRQIRARELEKRLAQELSSKVQQFLDGLSVEQRFTLWYLVIRQEMSRKFSHWLLKRTVRGGEEIMEKIVGSKITGIVLLLVSCLFFFASDGFSAAEAPSKARIIWNNIMLFVNFGIIVFLFLKYAKKPLLDFIFKEREKIKEKLDELEREYENARFILNEQSKKLSNIEVYVQEIRRNILELARREREKIIEEARRNADRMLEEAKSYNEIEAKRAKQRLQEELIIMAISFVKNRLREKMTNEMNEKVIAEFIKDMEESVKN
jgi:F-type H+-transporting ATPase subunit b